MTTSKRCSKKHRYRQAFERLLELYEVKVFRMAVMFLRDAIRAEEVAQDIFLKLWQVLPGYDGRAVASTWLYTIARNTCLSAARSEAHRKTSPLDAIPEPAEAGSDVLNRIKLEQCLEQLPHMQRDVITLFYLQEKSVVAEAARMLDLPGTLLSLARVSTGQSSPGRLYLRDYPVHLDTAISCRFDTFGRIDIHPRDVFRSIPYSGLVGNLGGKAAVVLQCARRHEKLHCLRARTGIDVGLLLFFCFPTGSSHTATDGIHGRSHNLVLWCLL